MAAKKVAKPSVPVLSLRDVNRALLARQMLLAREKTTPEAAMKRLAGMQAQIPGPPYIGLWTRLTTFEKGDLASAIEAREIIRATAMRGTIHELTLADFMAFRPALQPMLTKAFVTFGARSVGIDPEPAAASARRALAQGPLTFTHIRAAQERDIPGVDPRMLGLAARVTVPLVQVPGKGTWGFPTDPAFELAERWVGKPLGPPIAPKDFVRRYLAAFGPAEPRDFKTWSGFDLKEAFEALKPELAEFQDERGRSLFDLPNAPRPGGDVAAPVRFLPEFDNILLSHVDRTRIVPEEHRKGVYVPTLRVVQTFLVDGFVRGRWSFENKKKTATVTLSPFDPIDAKSRKALVEEGEKLARFLGEGATNFAVSVPK